MPRRWRGRRAVVTPMVIAIGVIAVCVIGVGAAVSLAIDRNDIMSMFAHRGIRPAHPPYTDRFLEYPVVVGMLAWVMSFAARTASQMLALYCLLAAVLVFVGGRLVAQRGELDRRWLPALPSLVFYGVHNYDLVAVVASMGGIFAFERGSWVAAGVLLALSTWTKLYAGLIAFAFALWLGRDALRRELARFGGAFATVSVALNLPVIMRSADGWLATFRFHVKRIPNWGSLWFYVVGNVHRQQVFSHPNGVGIVNAICTSAIVVGAIVLALWIWQRRPPPRAIACGAAIIFVLANKVFSPQYDLWLVPLMILATVPAPSVWRFAVIDAAVFADVFVVPIYWAHAGTVRTIAMSVLVLARAVVLVRVLRGLGQTGHPRVAGEAARPDDRSQRGLGFLDRT